MKHLILSSRTWMFVLLLFSIVVVVFPLTQSGYFRTDDGDWMVVRLAAFDRTLKSGQFPVRYLESLNHGYGYPVTDFLYPGPFYFGSLIHFFGFDYIDSVKILFALSFILGAAGMFLWCRQHFDFKSATLGAIVYTFSTYRLVDVYKRGSLGEAVAFLFIPFCFYFVNKYFQSSKYTILFLATSALALLIVSHNILAFIFLPILFLYAVAFVKNKQGFLKLSLIFIFGFGMSAFFWIPALYDRQFTIFSQVVVSNYANYFLKSFFDIKTFVGFATLFSFVILMANIYTFIKNKIFTLFLIFICLSIFLTLPASDFIWRMSFLPTLVQFPWRLLAVSCVLLPFLFAAVYSKSKYKIFLLLAIIVFGAIDFWSLSIDRTFYSDSFYSSNDDTTTVHDEYMPVFVKNKPRDKTDVVWQVLSGDSKVFSNDILVQSDSLIQLNKVYFPGLEIFANNTSVDFDYKTTGLPILKMSPGKYNLSWKLGETPVRKTADLLSIFSLSMLILLTTYQMVKDDKKQSY